MRSVATIAPTPGAAQAAAIPNNEGNIYVPGDAGGSTPIQAVIRLVTAPANVPTGITVLRAVQISFAKVADGSPVTELAKDVTIELSYAGLGLTDDQLSRLVIYNASRGEYLATTINRDRQVAVATTRRFSVFTLAQVIRPIPRVYLPLVPKSKSVAGGW